MMYYKTKGEGRPLVFLHGWALNSRVWDDVISQLDQHWKTYAVDLPGHGKSDLPENGQYDLDALVSEVASLPLENAVWVGWSLGGMIGLEIARRFPNLVDKLVLVAGSPQFVSSERWPHAVTAKTVDEFAHDLIKDYRSTILRFLAIQALGSDKAKQAIRTLKEKVFINGEPHIKALEEGLLLLKKTSLLQNVKDIDKPVHIILGERDTLIPSSSGEATQNLINHCQLTIIPGAGHAPFISHQEEFINVLNGFINE